MSISSDSADQVMRIMLEGEEICLKASGKAAIEIIKYVATILKKHQQTQGKTRLINLIRSGKQLDFFGVKKEDAIKIANEHLDEFKQVAINTIKEQGYSYNVNVKVGNFEFPTKTYGEFCKI